MRRAETVKIKFKKQRDSVSILGIIIATAIGVVMIAVATKLYTTTSYATKGDRLTQMQAERAKYIEMNKELETDIARLQSITRIEKEARERLGMVKSKPAVYIEMSKTTP